eukprot:gene19551-19987_t
MEAEIPLYLDNLLASTNTPTSNSFHPERPVKVAVRVRPFLADESDIGDRRTLSKLGDNLVIVNPSAFEADPDAIAAAALALDNKNWAHVFEFDHCLWSYNPETKLERFYDQEEVHITVGHEIVDSVLQGVSASCFAYGHTSTGKTYSLFGNVQTAKEAKNDKYNYLKLLTDAITPELGLIPRVFCDIIYNEKIRDLLSDGAVNNTDSRDFSQNHFASITSTPSSYYKTQQITPQQSQHQTQHQGGDSLKQDHSSLVRVQMVDLAGSERDPYGKEDDGNSQISMHNNHSGIGSA